MVRGRIRLILLTVLFVAPMAAAPDASAEGFIAFSRENFVGDNTADPSQVGVFTMNNERTARVQVRASNEANNPAFSPDGQQVAYLFRYKLFVVDRGGANERQITSLQDGDLFGPLVYLDATTVVATRSIAINDADLVKVSLVDGQITPLTSGIAEDTYPTVSPNGREVVFSRKERSTSSSTSCYHELWIIGADGQGLRRLMGDRPLDPTTPSGNKGGCGWAQPSYSPKGDNLLALWVGTGQGDAGEVWTMRSDGTAVKRTQVPGQYVSYPRYSAFETQITYLSPDPAPLQSFPSDPYNSKRNIWVATTDGSSNEDTGIRAQSLDWYQKPPPDRDGDGIADDSDACPDVFGVTANGCPDGDGDGVPDGSDRCPTVPGTPPSGCPDRDGDGVPDTGDSCPDAPGPAPSGCPDIDGDGVRDSVDNCIFVPNADQADRNNDGVGDVCAGAPPPDRRDSDGDGLLDRFDHCPARRGILPSGCPRTHVPDLYDVEKGNMVALVESASMSAASDCASAALGPFSKVSKGYKAVKAGKTFRRLKRKGEPKGWKAWANKGAEIFRDVYDCGTNLGVVSGNMVALAVDPPDPNYGQVARVQPIAVRWPKRRCATVPAGAPRRLCERMDKAALAHRRAQARVAELTEVVAITTNRFLEAGRQEGTAEEGPGQMLQRAAKQLYAARLVRALRAQSAAGRRLAKALRTDGMDVRTTAAQVKRTRARLRRLKGVPGSAVQRLVARGVVADRAQFAATLKAAFALVPPRAFTLRSQLSRRLPTAGLEATAAAMRLSDLAAVRSALMDGTADASVAAQLADDIQRAGEACTFGARVAAIRDFIAHARAASLPSGTAGLLIDAATPLTRYTAAVSEPLRAGC